jgi:hypothetical protein
MISHPQTNPNVGSTSPAPTSELGAEQPSPAEMASSDHAAVDDGAVNYEESPLLELEIDGTEYRLDAGRAGTALCISTRPSGSWSWVFRGEARWQAKVLRCKAFDRTVLTELSSALAAAAADSE